jgi:chemotaxis response regulator CheB
LAGSGLLGDALSLPALPASFSLPVLVVVHVPPDRSNMLVPLFQSKCRIKVKEAEDKDYVQGTHSFVLNGLPLA